MQVQLLLLQEFLKRKEIRVSGMKELLEEL